MVPTTCLSKKFKPSLGLDLIDSQSIFFIFDYYLYWIFFSFLSSGPALLTGDTEGSSRYFAGDGDNDVIHAPRLSINNSRLKYVSKSVQGQTSFMHKPYIYATSVLAIVQAGKALFYKNVNW